MDLKKNIRKNLIETKEKKENLLIEAQIIESRLMMIFENEENLNNYHLLPNKQKDKIAFLLIHEMHSLNNEKLLNEQLKDVLSNLFGNLMTGGIPQAIAERVVNFLLPNIIPQGFFRDTLISILSSHPIKFIQALGDCKKLTTVISEGIVEAFIYRLERSTDKGGSMVIAIFRNTLAESLFHSDWGKKIEGLISETVCGIYNKLLGKAETVLDKVKPEAAAATAPAS